MNRQEREDYRRYKNYVKEGHIEFMGAVRWFENGMTREKPKHQVKLRNLLRDLHNQGMEIDEIGKRIGLSYNQVSNIMHNYGNAVSKTRAELAIEELTS